MIKGPIALREEMKASNLLKIKDYLTWNIFRPLQELKNKSWIYELFKGAYRVNVLTKTNLSDLDDLQAYFRNGDIEKKFSPPMEYNLSLTRRFGATISEEATKTDVVLESTEKLILIETVLDSDIAFATLQDPTRDRLSRILDVGSAYAKTNNQEFFFIFLTPDLPYGTRLYHYRMHEFYHHPLGIKEKLPHRKDLSWHDLSDHIGWMTWEQVMKIWEKYVPTEEIIGTVEFREIKKLMEEAVLRVQM